MVVPIIIFFPHAQPNAFVTIIESYRRLCGPTGPDRGRDQGDGQADFSGTHLTVKCAAAKLRYFRVPSTDRNDQVVRDGSYTAEGVASMRVRVRWTLADWPHV